MNNHTKCLICSSEKIRLLPDYQKSHLCKCQACSFIFCKPIPTEQELIEYYEGYGRNDYLSPLTIKRYNELLDEFEPYRKTGKLLDVGCGIGYFLEEAKKRGWEVYGTEYTDEAVDICTKKGVNMQQGKLDPKNYPTDEFDIITSFEVIEHINNPQEELSNFNSILRKGGLVYVTTPNFNSLLRYRLKEAYNVICYPEHLSYYIPKTINLIFNKSGFKKEKVLTTGISISRLKAGKGKTNENPISKTSNDEQIRNKFESKWYLQLAKKSINAVLTLIGKGDSLKGYFVKK